MSEPAVAVDESRLGQMGAAFWDMSPDMFAVAGPNGYLTAVNPSWERVLGHTAQELTSRPFVDFIHPDDVDRTMAEVGALYEGRMTVDFENRYRDKDGNYHWFSWSARLIEGGEGLCCIARDVTERKLAEDRSRQQSREILELSTPVMQIWDGIVVVPLIGSLDSQRTALFMERLLDRIVETNSPMALVDITGVPTIDTQTAQHLIEAITAVRLLGAQVVLTGVRPAIAQTLVHLGVDLSGITTRSSMAAGLKIALEALSLRVVDREPGATKS